MPLYGSHAAWREGLGPGVSTTPLTRVRTEIPGRAPMQPRAQALVDPGAGSPGRTAGASRVALATSKWCLDVQCGRSVRDLICPVAPTLVNWATRRGCLGMEAGASECPTWMYSPWVATERRTKGASPRLRVANVSEPPGALIEPSRGLRFFLEAQRLSG